MTLAERRRGGLRWRLEQIVHAIRVAERRDRFFEGYCPDCDSPCEAWTEDGVSCGEMLQHAGGPLDLSTMLPRL